MAGREVDADDVQSGVGQGDGVASGTGADLQHG
jgi:hypothetical protein